jgi:flagellar basal-body rod modification protein FlgD
VTTPISGVTGTSPTTSSSTTTDKAANDKDMFMKLLVAQLKYQNPMSPTDGNQYMSQMAVFTQVEKLGQLVEAQQKAQAWQERLSAQTLVGTEVSGVDADEVAHTGVVKTVTFGDDGPLLTLADGSSIAVGDVTTVELHQ